MKYRCAECHRGLFNPAYVHPSGWVLGRVCAKRLGKIAPKCRAVKKGGLLKTQKHKRKARPMPCAAVVAQAGQFDLFEVDEKRLQKHLIAL